MSINAAMHQERLVEAAARNEQMVFKLSEELVKVKVERDRLKEQLAEMTELYEISRERWNFQ